MTPFVAYCKTWLYSSLHSWNFTRWGKECYRPGGRYLYQLRPILWLIWRCGCSKSGQQLQNHHRYPYRSQQRSIRAANDLFFLRPFILGAEIRTTVRMRPRIRLYNYYGYFCLKEYDKPFTRWSLEVAWNNDITGLQFADRKCQAAPCIILPNFIDWRRFVRAVWFIVRYSIKTQKPDYTVPEGYSVSYESCRPLFS